LLLFAIPNSICRNRAVKATRLGGKTRTKAVQSLK